jgi:hypothetical protein
MRIAASLAARVAVEVEARASIQFGTFGGGGTASGAALMEAVLEGSAQFNDKGAAISYGAFAGVGMAGSVEGTVSVAGISVTAGAGVSSGWQVGASGAAHATYDDGVISFGLSGDLAFLLGFSFDFNIEIDIGAFVDAMEDVGEFLTGDLVDFFEGDFVDFFENDFVDFWEDVGAVLNPSNWW